jgi:hypothetical protein
MAILMEDLVLDEEHALCEKTEEISIKKTGKTDARKPKYCMGA